MNIASKHASGGRMVKWKGRVASIAPALASVSVVALMSTGALAYTFDTVETTPQLISSDEDVSITADGGISLFGGSNTDVLNVDVGDVYNGTITNDGTIEAVQNTASTLTGIHISDELAGAIVNNGDISLTLLADDTVGSVTGIWVQGDLSGSITNSASGVIDVQVLADSTTVSAYGIFISGDVTVTGVISNSGTISAEASTGSSSSASAYGIYIDDSVAGAITNTSSGVIEVYAHSASDVADAYGIYVTSDVTETGSITNAGSISVTAQSGYNSSAYAYGIYVGGQLDGSIDNTGSIDVYAESGDSYASAYGIYVGGDVNGSINSAGSISAEALDFADSAADAFGIYVGGSLNGDLTNSGTIDAFAHSTTTDVHAYGVYVSSGVNGSLTNTATGVISAHAETGDSVATAFGVYVGGGVGEYSEILNAGEITATAESIDSYADAYGIFVNNDVTGTVTNTETGVITATAKSFDDDAVAYGVKVGGTLRGTIDNAGSIVASADGLDTAYGYAYGVRVDYVSSTGVINNSGSIEASAYGDTFAQSFGVYVNNDMDGTIDNSGSITVDATANSSNNDTAFGILVNGGLNGDIINSGTIDVAAWNYSETAYAYGIEVNGISNGGSISNSGDIIASAVNTSSSAYAFGVVVNGNLDGQVLNTGTINASAEAGVYNIDSNASAFGVYVNGTMNGHLENSGSILADAHNVGEEDAYAYGVYVNGAVFGQIINTGLIDITASSDSSDASAYGIYAAAVAPGGFVANAGEIYASADAGDDSYSAGVYLENFWGIFGNLGKIVADDAIVLSGGEDGYGYAVLRTGGFIEGNINLNGAASLDVDGDRGMSVHWTANDAVTGAGNNYATSFVDGINVFTRDLDNSNPEFATFDASGIVANRQAGADASFAGLGALVSNTAKSTAPSVQVTSGFTGEGAFKPFVIASGSSMTYAGSDVTMDQKVQSHSIAVGGSKQSDSGLTFGVAAGASSADTTVTGRWNTASESSVSGAFGGVSVAKAIGSVTISGGLTAGTLGFDNTRYVNDNTIIGGVTEQTASYDSNYIGTEIGLSGRFQVGAGLALLPSATLRYASHSVSGFTENGDSSEAEVASNRFGVAEGELGLTLEKTMDAGVLSIGISEVSRSFNGDTAVGVLMIGDEHTVDASAPNSSATKLSIGFNAGNVGSAQFNVGAETIVGSGGVSGSKIGGSISFSF